MGRRKTVSSTAGAPSEPPSAHTPTPDATHPSPPPGDAPSPGPEDINAFSRLLEGGDAESRPESARHSPAPATPTLEDRASPGPSEASASPPRMTARDKGKGRAPLPRVLSPVFEADPSMEVDGVISTDRTRPPSPPPRPPAIPRGLVHPSPGPSGLAGAPGPASRDRIPQVLGKRPSLAPDTDEFTPARIVLTEAELQAIIQEHVRRLLPTTASITPPGTFPPHC